MALISVPSLAQQDATPPATQLTLDAAVSLAMSNNRQLKRIFLDIEKAQDEVAATRTERLPQFRLNLLEAELLTPISFQVPVGSWGTFPATGAIPAQNTPITTAVRPI